MGCGASQESVGDSLNQKQQLDKDKAMTSPNGENTLVHKGSGKEKFELKNKDGKVLWSLTFDKDTPSTHLMMQEDGNLVLFNDESEIWSTKTAGSDATSFKVTDAGTCDLVDKDGKKVWSSHEEKPEEPKKEEAEETSVAAAPAAAAAAPADGGSNVNWAELRDKMPTEKTGDQKKERMRLFSEFDPNGNGYLSLAEVQKGCRDVLKLHDVFEAEPVVMRAFQAAKGANDRKNKPGSHGPDFVEKCEFRLLLVYLRQYFELWVMFEQVDSSDDARVDLEEFKSCLGKIEAWGLKVDDAEAEFKAIDTNDGGKILFREFAEWAIAKQLDLTDDDEDE